MEEWYTLDDIQESSNTDKLYCISVDSPDRQFLAGKLEVPSHNTEQGKADDQAKGEAQLLSGSIARLGRAAGVHILLATQRPDATLIPGELRSNLTTRINCGRTDPTASSMILNSAEGTRVNGAVRGRLYVSNHGQGNHGQGFYQDQDWIDNWLKGRGLNPDGSPLGTATKRTFSSNIADFAESDLDSKTGVSNEDYIKQLQEEDAELISQTPVNFAEEYTEEYTPPESSFGRPELGANSGDTNKFHRPEEDFDTDLEDLIAMNFDD